MGKVLKHEDLRNSGCAALVYEIFDRISSLAEEEVRSRVRESEISSSARSTLREFSGALSTRYREKYVRRGRT